MSYVKHILLPTEQVLYDGHVHPTVLLPGFLMLGLAAWMLTETGHTGGAYSMLMGITSFLGEYSDTMSHLNYRFERWQAASPGISLDLKILALGLTVYGLYRLIKALILMDTTELIITDKRIIAKMGLFTVTTVEMDRRRIAGVTIYQNVPGRIMGYGTVLIKGFTSNISGLPPMVDPHLVERFVA